jgi:hypothetical protein
MFGRFKELEENMKRLERNVNAMLEDVEKRMGSLSKKTHRVTIKAPPDFEEPTHAVEEEKPSRVVKVSRFINVRLPVEDADDLEKMMADREKKRAAETRPTVTEDAKALVNGLKQTPPVNFFLKMKNRIREEFVELVEDFRGKKKE